MKAFQAVSTVSACSMAARACCQAGSWPRGQQPRGNGLGRRRGVDMACIMGGSSTQSISILSLIHISEPTRPEPI
eukprot:2006891-Pyramimonas_sp.AAC.1